MKPPKAPSRQKNCRRSGRTSPPGRVRAVGGEPEGCRRAGTPLASARAGSGCLPGKGGRCSPSRIESVAARRARSDRGNGCGRSGAKLESGNTSRALEASREARCRHLLMVLLVARLKRPVERAVLETERGPRRNSPRHLASKSIERCGACERKRACARGTRPHAALALKAVKPWRCARSACEMAPKRVHARRGASSYSASLMHLCRAAQKRVLTSRARASLHTIWF